MNVGELKAILERLPDDVQIVGYWDDAYSKIEEVVLRSLTEEEQKDKFFKNSPKTILHLDVSSYHSGPSYPYPKFAEDGETYVDLRTILYESPFPPD